MTKRLLWGLNLLSTAVQLVWPYKEMLTLQRWSDARPAGRVRQVYSTMPRALNTKQESKRFNCQVGRNTLPIWVWLIYGWHPVAISPPMVINQPVSEYAVSVCFRESLSSNPWVLVATTGYSAVRKFKWWRYCEALHMWRDVRQFPTIWRNLTDT